MCGSPKVPDVVVPVDPQIAADKAAAEAAAKANADGATRTKARRVSALSTGAGLAPASALSSGGKTTLGM